MALAAVINQVAPLHFARGSRTGARTAADFTITLPFEPKFVKVVNLTNKISGEWADVNASNLNQLIRTAANLGTYPASYNISVANNIVTVIVATSGLESDNNAVYWEAWG
jgi:hypothetical protein